MLNTIIKKLKHVVSNVMPKRERGGKLIESVKPRGNTMPKVKRYMAYVGVSVIIGLIFYTILPLIILLFALLVALDFAGVFETQDKC
jgi:Flp pilus assembly protein TadB